MSEVSDQDPGLVGQLGDGNDNQLPPWLNLYELLAWVRYRDSGAVRKANDWWGLAGLTAYSVRPAFVGRASLQQALLSGKLIAWGAKRGASFSIIPSVEWTRLKVAPLDLGQQWPYVDIRVDSADAQAAFPPVGYQPPVVKEKRKPGRKPGSGTYAKADAPLLTEMAALIANGDAKSAHRAAQLVAGKAKGTGCFESTVDRLARALRRSELN